MVRKDVWRTGWRRDEQISLSVGLDWRLGGRRLPRRTLGEEGVSHFIEHMVFKGTRRRSAEAISARSMRGGKLNAHVPGINDFYSTVLDEYITEGIDLLAEIFNIRFDSRN